MCLQNRDLIGHPVVLAASRLYHPLPQHNIEEANRAALVAKAATLNKKQALALKEAR